MNSKILIVPGYHGSGENHWQTWLERALPGCERVRGIDWERPELFSWADAIDNHIEKIGHRVILVAHSFGCLASSIVASRRPDQVNGLIMVAPASPLRFSLHGLIEHESDASASIAVHLPRQKLETTGLLVASENDPWLSFAHAKQLSRFWGLAFYNAGPAGHINSDSGHGQWPLIRELVLELQEKTAPDLSGSQPLYAARAFDHLPGGG
ncbi:alpha/beta hydrolase [Methylomarinum sp. Ch1-1]|uniref:Alpha/beta hydrolase n=1 Tax=Methylomarinum roseum TaxID=3067653 RepID=A0AAU7NQZ7_9GAMM|nr:alpha/beta hydrolase [Methylomarinum sp. Ch1-1]MDP4520661.1 alpha/beta hydrolase [Methylomarinum sp. Ch1-1]